MKKINYKARKKEAIKQLEETELKLLRISDIIAEIKRQIRSFENEARKVEKYKQLSEELKQAEKAAKLKRLGYKEISEKVHDVEYEKLIAKVDGLRKRREKIGYVNLIALEEYNKLKERYYSLLTQENDLRDEKESLMKTIMNYKLIEKNNRLKQRMLKDEYYSTFKAFKIEAVNSLIQARKESIKLKHYYIGVTHLLFGIINSRSSAALRLFKKMRINIKKVKNEVKKELSLIQKEEIISKKITYTKEAKRVLIYAVEEAGRMDCKSISIEHLFLGLIKKSNTLQKRYLQIYAIGKARSIVMKLMNKRIIKTIKSKLLDIRFIGEIKDEKWYQTVNDYLYIWRWYCKKNDRKPTRKIKQLGESVVDRLKMFIKKNKKYKLNIYMAIGNCYMHIKRYKESEQYLLKVKKLVPKNDCVINKDLAVLYRYLGKWDEATSYIARILLKNPTYLDMNMNFLNAIVHKEKYALGFKKIHLKYYK